MKQARRALMVSFLTFFSSLIGINAEDVLAQPAHYFSGFYGGVEVGAISYNTQITFDGVDDPAGRGGVGYGVFLGYNQMYKKALLGAELMLNLPSVPDPYTFDPVVTGFSDLDLRRRASFGLDVRAGFLLSKRVKLFGSLGYSANKQSVRIDKVPLEEFAGGAADVSFGIFQVGAGLEIALHKRIGIRFLFRTLTGQDLNITDFGSIPIEASLMRFDVEPSQQQFFTGIIFRV